jgi:putative acetyltransferase
MTAVRKERPEDVPAIRQVNKRAFGQPVEADVVDKLRRTCEGFLSLVATNRGRVVGHILFSPATVERQDRTVLQGMGLAPMAVLPEYQRQGIGSLLVRGGLSMLRASACPFVIVLGHPEYYPRFGFERASRYGLRSQWEGVPDEAFMILVFDAPTLAGASGVVRYRSEFDAAM